MSDEEPSTLPNMLAQLCEAKIILRRVPSRPKKAEQFFKKSYAQVAPSVIPKRVLQKAYGLKPKRKRPAPVPVRYSESQLEILKARAEKAGICRSEYIRVTSLKEEYRPRLGRAARSILLMLNRELTAWGNNLNQITKRYNSGQSNACQIEKEIEELRQPALKTLEAVRKALWDGDPAP